MSCFLESVSIVVIMYFRLASSHEFSRSGTTGFDLRTVIMLIIACSILLAIITLVGVVLCLYFKVSNALRDAKDPCLCSSGYLGRVSQDRVIPVKAVAMDSCRNLPCCDDCNMCTDVDPLPPCCCGTNEGL
ncbi:protein FAM24A [Ochotona princeps]|uniref:protein FAM24A n=1 Tax=Ochotona princeps TaxID=9978 RepID=UPI002714E81C|nr:protein FAM24A [Ochotona princeps]